jgi:hypothetical protein
VPAILVKSLSRVKSVAPCSNAIAAIKASMVVKATPFARAAREIVAASQYVENPLGSSISQAFASEFTSANADDLRHGLHAEVRITLFLVSQMSKFATVGKGQVNREALVFTLEHFATGGNLLTICYSDRRAPASVKANPTKAKPIPPSTSRSDPISLLATPAPVLPEP